MTSEYPSLRILQPHQLGWAALNLACKRSQTAVAELLIKEYGAVREALADYSDGMDAKTTVRPLDSELISFFFYPPSRPEYTHPPSI